MSCEIEQFELWSFTGEGLVTNDRRGQYCRIIHQFTIWCVVCVTCCLIARLEILCTMVQKWNSEF